MGDGPARGDLAHWRYETFDLAPFLTAGANLVTATVWNFGIYAPTAQITDRTAFLLQGDGALEADLSTPKDWMVAIEPGRIAVPRTTGGPNGYMANGPGEELNATAYDWQWDAAGDASSAWVAAGDPMRENIYPSAARAGLEGEQVDNHWQLVPDELPTMTYILRRKERQCVRMRRAPKHFLRTLLTSRPIATCMRRSTARRRPRLTRN